LRGGRRSAIAQIVEFYFSVRSITKGHCRLRPHYGAEAGEISSRPAVTIETKENAHTTTTTTTTNLSENYKHYKTKNKQTNPQSIEKSFTVPWLPPVIPAFSRLTQIPSSPAAQATEGGCLKTKVKATCLRGQRNLSISEQV
jgi:hypothetical protein